MDPISQGVLGAIAAQTQGSKNNLGKTAFIGALSGMAADLDALIHSSTDPLLALEYHRHFTHSLAFIPFGALACSLIFFFLLAKRWTLSFQQIFIWCFMGYATHALLDACTSYGTQLLWPFSNARIAWDSISIIDPLFTLPLLALTIFAITRKKRAYVIAALSWATLYLCLGFFQHERAQRIGYELAESRGHHVKRLETKPSFGNLIVWKIIYETENRFYVDAVKLHFTKSEIKQGSNVEKLNISRDLPWLNTHSLQALDIERFSHFSAGFLALDTQNPHHIVDMRYSLLPNEISPLWGIALSPEKANKQHAIFYSDRGDSKKALKQLWQLIWE